MSFEQFNRRFINSDNSSNSRHYITIKFDTNNPIADDLSNLLQEIENNLFFVNTNSNEQTNSYRLNPEQVKRVFQYVKSDSNNLSLKNEEYYCQNITSKDNTRDELTCSICVNQIDNLEEGCMISCTHSYHKKCIDEWLNIKKNCPSCRKDCLKYDKEKKEFIEQPINKKKM